MRRRFSTMPMSDWLRMRDSAMATNSCMPSKTSGVPFMVPVIHEKALTLLARYSSTTDSLFAELDLASLAWLSRVKSSMNVGPLPTSSGKFGKNTRRYGDTKSPHTDVPYWSKTLRNTTAISSFCVNCLVLLDILRSCAY